MNSIRVLFLAANPQDTSYLALDEEIRAITQKIRGSAYRESIELISGWAVRADDLLQSLNEQKPQIVHFSGHGDSTGGIILVDSKGLAKPVSKVALSSLFRVLGNSVKVVVLNACYSREQAEAIAEEIDCVIGVNAIIGDEAAITFSASFYRAIGFGHSVQQAFEQGKVALQLEGISEERKFELICKSDPSSIHLLSHRASFTNNLRPTQKLTKVAQNYLLSIIDRYETLEKIYTDLPVTIEPQAPAEFFPTLVDMNCFQVLIERSFGQEYRTIERVQRDRIQDVIRDYPRIVLLGDPGCGKTVAIWRLALDYARKAIKEPQRPWPVVIELGQYDGSISLYNWILSYHRIPPNFSNRLKSGSLVLFLDGLNEIPKTGYSKYMIQLQRFLVDYKDCQFVITCRRLDYDETLRLQRVEIEPLDEERISAFISRYINIDEESERLYTILEKQPKLLELASNALNLKLIIALYAAVGDRFPHNRGKLIDGFVAALYERETNKSRAIKITESELRTTLGKLAFDIQLEVGKGTSVDKNWAMKRIRHHKLHSNIISIINLAMDMGLLEVVQSSLKFQHQLIQEYFVAIELEKNLADKKTRESFWVPIPSMENVSMDDSTSSPLPPPPTTGWEEATIMLAGVKHDASHLITQVIEINRILAARCIIEGRASVKPSISDKVVEQLLALINNREVKLNIRIQAGNLLGELEDPRFEQYSTAEGNILFLPPLTEVPDGNYLVGSDRNEVSDSYLDEIPRHTVELESFWIGRFPVTNAEFACFIRSGGYDSHEYWTEEGWAWRIGQFSESLKQWILNGYRDVRIQVIKEVDRLEPSRKEDSEEMDFWYKALMEWSDERVEKELNRLFDERNCHPHSAPCYWDDPVFNGNTQPVITTWFEAQAYCKWISRVTDKHYRLPTEVEWEAATGGSGQTYPWGNEPQIAKLNILPSRVLRTTPVGVYPAGISVFGVYDLLGNVWEWTSSSKFPYPYAKEDGREKLFLSDSRRVVRGGSWGVSLSSARNSCRGNFPPDNMVRNYIGFRVVCEE
jgi:formylglycine-generating enzyme required for sulfatase activity